jgi:signal transduction histidine kinase
LFARPRPPQPRRFDLRLLLVEAVAALGRDPGGAAVQAAITGPDVTLTADPELVRASVLNLLLNASQAMNGRGTVRLSIRPGDAACVLDINDTGPGVPPDLRERIFEPFFTTKARGGGLGLPIARRTAELHGGTLELAAQDAGGACFRLTLPLETPAMPGDDDAPADAPSSRDGG